LKSKVIKEGAAGQEKFERLGRVRLGTEKHEADDWWNFVGVEWLQRRHGRAADHPNPGSKAMAAAGQFLVQNCSLQIFPRLLYDSS